MTEDQRRGAQRIPLPDPLEGKLGDIPVRILEMSLIGCRVEHGAKVHIGARMPLRFSFDSTPVTLPALVTRTELRSGTGALIYISGIELAKSVDECPPELLEVMGHTARQIPVSVPPPFAPAPFMRYDDDDDEQAAVAVALEVEAAPASAAPVAFALTTLEAYDEVSVATPVEAAIAVTPGLALKLDLGDETVVMRPVEHYLECNYAEGVWSRRVSPSSTQPREGFTIPLDEEGEVEQYCRTYEAADPDLRKLIRLTLELNMANRKRRT